MAYKNYGKFNNSTEAMEAKSTVRRLVEIMRKYGDNYKKKHGCWIRLDLSYNDYSLILDTWNKGITVHQNTFPMMNNGPSILDASICWGFGNQTDVITVSWGGFNANLPMVKFWLGHAISCRK